MCRRLFALLLLCRMLFAVAAFASAPLVTSSDAPYAAPRFDCLHVADLESAIEQGLREFRAEIDAIKAVAPSEATFDNVIVPYARSGRTLSAARAVLSHLRMTQGTDSVVRLALRMEPILSREYDSVRFDSVVFNLIRTIYVRRDSLPLDSLQRRALDRYYRSVAENGALCTPEQKRQLLKINAELSDKTIRFEQNVKRADEKFLFFVTKDASLPESYKTIRDRMLSRAEKLGRGGYWAVSSAEYGTIMAMCPNRDVRERLYKAYMNRCGEHSPYDNTDLVARILNLRLEKARILGFDTYADYALDGTAAKTPEKAAELLQMLLRAAVARSRDDVAEIQAFAVRTMGRDFRVEAWDVAYYSYRLRTDKYGSASHRLHTFLGFDDVLKGVFHVTQQLYGITFTPRTDISVYHRDVRVFEALDRDGAQLGLLYLDPLSRRGKRAGAWTGNLRYYGLTSSDEQLPLVTVCCNFPPSAPNRPLLLTPSRVRTLFHEFGHALARLLARGPYPTVTGSFPRDMSELPSQLMEHWAWEPQVLKTYARNSETGRPISNDLIEKYRSEELYMKSVELSRSYAMALFDLTLHGITSPVATADVQMLQGDLYARYELPACISSSPASLFSHIFAGPYAARFYSYAWASVLDTDAFAAFTQTGDIFDRATADRFRLHILTQIGYDDAMKQYLRFRGAEPDPRALMRRFGLESPRE